MKKTLLLLSLFATLGMSAVSAQTTDDPAGDAGLDLGEPVNSGPAANQAYTKEVFTDWALNCLKVSEDREVCQMNQLLKDEAGANVAEVNIFRLSNSGQAVAGGTFTVPLETLLTQKLMISVDGREAKRYDYSFCTQVGCFARVGFTADDIARYKAGKEATVTIVPVVAPDRTVSVKMSLAGFTAAFDQTTELTP